MLKLACPHCGEPIQIVRQVATPISFDCPHCGKKVLVQPTAQAAPSLPPRTVRRSKGKKEKKRTLPGGPILIGGAAAVAACLLIVVLISVGRSGAEHGTEDSGQHAAKPAQVAPEAERNAGVTWPDFTPANYPGLPQDLQPVARPVKIQWHFEPGLELLYRGQLRSEAALSPLDLGKTAQQVLRFLDEKELTLALRCERIDAGLATVRGEVKRLRGKMQAPSGRLEYDSRDGVGFTPVNSPLARLARRPWQIVVATDNGQILRVEWPDGEIIEGAELSAILSVLPLLQLPTQAQSGRDYTATVPDDRAARYRLLGKSASSGELVFACLLTGSSAADGPERRLLFFAPQSGVITRMTLAYERQRGTGLPRVGRFRPTLRTTGVIELLR